MQSSLRFQSAKELEIIQKLMKTIINKQLVESSTVLKRDRVRVLAKNLALFEKSLMAKIEHNIPVIPETTETEAEDEELKKKLEDATNKALEYNISLQKEKTDLDATIKKAFLLRHTQHTQALKDIVLKDAPPSDQWPSTRELARVSTVGKDISENVASFESGLAESQQAADSLRQFLTNERGRTRSSVEMNLKQAQADLNSRSLDAAAARCIIWR